MPQPPDRHAAAPHASTTGGQPSAAYFSWVAMSAATSFPSWVMLERFVFRRDDDESFPDESKAPVRASGATSWRAPFRVAFELDDAPRISRLYAQLPGFPDPSKQTPLAILATHRHLVLLRVGMKDSTGALLQDFFVYDASNSIAADSPCSSLTRLPTCTLRDKDEQARLRRRLRRTPPPSVLDEEYRRVMYVASMGFLSRGEGGGDFAVAELNFVCPDAPLVADKCKVHADLFFLRSSEPGSDGAVGSWNYARLPVRSSNRSDRLTWPDFSWETDAVIPAGNCLCWIDYHRGIISCDLFQELPQLALTFSGFPQDEFSLAEDPIIASCWFYCGASAMDAGRALRIVRVIRQDGKRYGPLEADAGGFTIACHTFVSDATATGAMVWCRDYSRDCTVTSEELWSHNPPEKLPRTILMFPQVNIDRPHVIHFLVVHEFRLVMKKMSVLTIDMNTRIAESCVQYINGSDDIGTEYADLMKRRSCGPQSFLASDFSKFLHVSRLSVCSSSER